MIKQDLSEIKEIDKLLDENLSEVELNENIKKIKKFLLTDEYIPYSYIKDICNKISFDFSKEEVKQIVYNTQDMLFLYYLIDKKMDIDFGNGKYTDDDLKAISKIGWKHYASLVPDVEELLAWSIKTSYLDKYDVQFCNENKLKIDWNKILLKIIESKRTKSHFKFVKAILNFATNIKQDENLTKLAIFNYESKITVELCKHGWIPELNKTEIKLWLDKSNSNIVNAISTLESIIKYNIYPVKEIVNEILYLDYNIKLLNPLQAAIWKILRKLSIIIDTSVIIHRYLKLNHKQVSKNLFDYLHTTSLKCKYDWLSLFKIAGRNGNGYFMDLIVAVDRNYYECEEFKYDISEFCRECSIETMEKFSKYQKEIQITREIIEYEIASQQNIDLKIEKLENELKKLKHIKKGK